MKKELIRKHAKVLLGGILHSLKGTAATIVLALGGVACYCVTQESGYIAVGLFVAALLIIAGAIALFYNMGRDVTDGKYSK